MYALLILLLLVSSVNVYFLLLLVTPTYTTAATATTTATQVYHPLSYHLWIAQVRDVVFKLPRYIHETIAKLAESNAVDVNISAPTGVTAVKAVPLPATIDPAEFRGFLTFLYRKYG